MKKGTKKIIAIISGLYFVCMQIFYPINIKAANGSKKKSLSSYEVYGNRDYERVYGYEKKKLVDDVKKDTKILDNNLEKALNYAGVSDDDIFNLSNKELEQIEEADRINVKVEYFSENSKQLEKMSDKEVSDYYEEKYEEESQELNQTSILDKLLGSQEVKAESDIDAYRTSGGKFKHTIYEITKRINGEKSIYFIYSATWLETPKYRGYDYYKIKIDNGHLQKGYNTYFKYTKFNRSYKISTGKCIRNVSETIQEKPKVVKHYFGTNSYLCSGQPFL